MPRFLISVYRLKYLEKRKRPASYAGLISFIYFGGVRMNEIKKWEYVTSSTSLLRFIYYREIVN